MSIQSRIRTLAPAISLALAGCSSVQIDVDVYKGPLANEPDIQVQQFAALAIAARPLLASLRTDIEDAQRKLNGDDSVHKRVLDPAKREGYLDDRDIQFTSRLARFVNGALFAYEDVREGPEAELLSHYSRLMSMVERLNVSERDRILAGRIDKALVAKKTKFAEEFKQFLCGKSCDSSDVGKARGTPKMLFAWEDDKTYKPRACLAGHDSDCTVEPRSNEGFELLRDSARVARYSVLLFGKVDTEFVDRMVELGSSYREGRTLMRAIVISSSAVLEKAALERNAAKAASAAAALSASIQPAILACTLASHGSVSRYPAEAASLLNALTRGIQNGISSTANPGMAKNLANHAKDLREAVSVARVVRDIDSIAVPVSSVPVASSSEMKCGDLSVDKDYLRDIVVPQARWYGLARGVNSAADLEAMLGQLGAPVAAIGGANASGFERARLPKGLETLTREYREASLAGSGDRQSGLKERRMEALGESLLFFSERVLFVVNTLSKSAFRSELVGIDDATVARFSSRMATLQTLGNTLVLHANDLHRRRAQRTEQALQGPAEAAFANAAYAPGADMAYDAFALAAEAEVKKLTATKLAQTGRAGQQDAVVTSLTKQVTDAEQASSTAEQKLTSSSAAKATVEAALRTMFESAPAEQTVKNLKAQELRDQKRIREAVNAFAEKNKEDIDALVLLEELMARLDEMAGESSPPKEQSERRKLAAGFIREQKDGLSLVTTVPKKAPAIFEALRVRLSEIYKDNAGETDEAATSSSRKKETLAALKKRLDAAKKERESTGTTLAKVETEIPQARAVREELQSARSAVIGKAIEANVRDGAGIRRLLLDHLKGITPSSDAKKQSIAQSTSFLEQFTPPSRFTISAKSGGRADLLPRDVLDQTIAALRHQRIEALASGDEPRAQNLANAIDAAYEARQSTVFLRPSSEYLKSVYSSTALAEGPQSVYRNLLVDYLNRLNPMGNDHLSEFDVRAKEAKEQVEKLYWQNINRVTVSGGGATNTVLAKDDIGNWYVKAYSADPEAIIQSAKSLALFRSGQKVDVNLLRRADLQRRVDDTNLGEAERNRAKEELKQPAETVAGLSRVQARVRSNYEADTATSADALRASMVSLPDDLKAAAGKSDDFKDVSGDLDTLVANAQAKQLLSAQSQIRDAYDLKEGDPGRLVKLQDAIIEGLKSLRKFAREVIAGAEALKDKSATGSKAAVALVRSESTKRIEASASRQKAALDRMDAGLVLIGEAKSAK